MTQRIHFFAGLLATLTIAGFFSASLFSELLGSKETIVAVKALIVMPGLVVLIPAIAATGVSGFILSKSRQGDSLQARRSECLSSRPMGC